MKHSFSKHDNYQKCAVGLLWYGNRVMLSKRKGSTWDGYYGGIGGKVDSGETIVKALEREIYEEGGIFVPTYAMNIIDAFVDDESQQKAFIFEVGVYHSNFEKVKNTEPHKRDNWQLFTKQQAARLKLIPRLRKIIHDTDVSKVVVF